MLRLLLAAVMFVAAFGAASAAEKRVALVIGNGAYENAVALPNPRNDAADMSAKLEALGFTVITGIDQTHDMLEATLRNFAREVRDAQIALFFYSGHGIQVAGRNYIIPIDARLEDATALDFETVDADRIFSYMGGDNRVALAFLDACRDNPLSRRFAAALPKSRSSAVGLGLAMPATAGTGLFIGFSTAPGDTAADGTGRNSPFTTALLKHIGEPGLEIQQVLTRVKSDVQVATGGDQRPWTNSDLSAEVFLVPAVARVEEPAVAVVDPSPAVAEDSEEEAFAWNLVKSGRDADALEVFIRRYPNGAFAGEAFALLRRLDTAEPAPLGTSDEQAISAAEIAAFIDYINSPTPAEDVAGFVATHYADRVAYYGNTVGKPELAADKQRWYDRWQDWSVTLVGSPSIGPRGDGAYDVEYRFRYEWIGRPGTVDEGTVLTGEAISGLVVRKLDGRIVILSETSEVVDDQDDPARALVMAVQKELGRAGCNPGAADGQWGPRSRRAVEAFAAATGIALSGEPDQQLLTVLNARPGRVCPETAREPEQATASNCVFATITFQKEHPNGGGWDSPFGDLPDPLVTELTTGAAASCEDSLTCSMRIDTSVTSLSFTIYDKDTLRSNELMGQGECRVGETCSFGPTHVALSPC